MKNGFLACALFLTLFYCNPSSPQAPQTTAEESKSAPKLSTGVWRAVLKSPGGDLPFRLEIKTENNQYAATAHNGTEVLTFDSLTVDAQANFRMAIDHYDSIFEGRISADGKSMKGVWHKVVDHTRTAKLNFEAEYGQNHRFETKSSDAPAQFGGTWDVTFSPGLEDEGPAVATFIQNNDHLTGTFMTPTGDYRFLEGNVVGNTMYLSCFDGGHAFLFKAVRDDTGMLQGEFWSSDKWHEPWTGVANEAASLPDAMSLTSLMNTEKKFRFNFPGIDGQLINQDDPRFANKVVVISIFGTWCPNCNDEAPFLQELYATYKDQGLEVVGLAFEATGDAERDTRMLKRFKKRHKLDYLLLLAGQKDKSSAGAKLPDINHVLAYPTTLFINPKGQVAHIHTGFTGPGTGEAYVALKAKYHKMIGELLSMRD